MIHQQWGELATLSKDPPMTIRNSVFSPVSSFVWFIYQIASFVRWVLTLVSLKTSKDHALDENKMVCANSLELIQFYPWLTWQRFFTSGVGIFPENLKTNPTNRLKNHATSPSQNVVENLLVPTLEVYVSCVQCHWMQVPTPKVYREPWFHKGVGLQRAVPLDGSAHARGSAHATGL